MAAILGAGFGWQAGYHQGYQNVVSERLDTLSAQIQANQQQTIQRLEVQSLPDSSSEQTEAKEPGKDAESGGSEEGVFSPMVRSLAETVLNQYQSSCSDTPDSTVCKHIRETLIGFLPKLEEACSQDSPIACDIAEKINTLTPGDDELI